MNPTHTEGERLAVLESQTSEIRLTMNNLSGDIKALNSSVDRYFNQSLTQHTKTGIEVAQLQRDVAEIKRKNGLWAWLSPTLAAAGGAVLAILILNYLQHPH